MVYLACSCSPVQAQLEALATGPVVDALSDVDVASVTVPFEDSPAALEPGKSVELARQYLADAATAEETAIAALETEFKGDVTVRGGLQPRGDLTVSSWPQARVRHAVLNAGEAPSAALARLPVLVNARGDQPRGGRRRSSRPTMPSPASSIADLPASGTGTLWAKSSSTTLLPLNDSAWMSRCARAMPTNRPSL